VGHHAGKEHERTVGVSLFLRKICGASSCQQSWCQSDSSTSQGIIREMNTPKERVGGLCRPRYHSMCLERGPVMRVYKLCDDEVEQDIGAFNQPLVIGKVP
jgi:hypothetical protein